MKVRIVSIKVSVPQRAWCQYSGCVGGLHGYVFLISHTSLKGAGHYWLFLSKRNQLP